MGADAGQLQQGSLLVADPGLADPNFRRTVVFIVRHTDDGTVGVVLNRPGTVPVAQLAPQWAGHVTPPASVFIGGPVQRGMPLCLAALPAGQTAATVPGTLSVRGSIALLKLDSDPDDLVPRLAGMRIFTGYAGWGYEQLADEIARGDWMIVPALPDDVLVGPGIDLWACVLRRQGLPTALLATHPCELQRN